MSQKRKTGSGKERAGAVRVAHAVEDTSPAALPSTAALLTDCILPGIEGSLQFTYPFVDGDKPG